MGYSTPHLPRISPPDYLGLPFMDRMKLLTRHWVEYGFGSPKRIQMMYIYKMAFYLIAGLSIAWATSPGLASFNDVSDWWTEPIVYQKLMIWTVLFEGLGVGASSGPLAFKFKPMIGGIVYWRRVGTIRVPPWPRTVPFTSGALRTAWDVGVYLLVLTNIVVLLVLPGIGRGVTPGDGGLVRSWPIFTLLGLQVVLGLRDKVAFLATRPEQYMTPMFCFATLSLIDMMIACKIILVVVWIGAGVSKFGGHFSNVVPPMLSNAPFLPSKWIRRKLYRNFPEDLRPSRFAHFMAHVAGTTVEILLPLVLLFATNRTVMLLAVIGMIAFHLFITSAFPLAVPLEWNVFFMFATAFLFWHRPAGGGYSVTDISSPWVIVVLLIATLTFPILGNLRPDLVSFLPSMRQYAGNWASAVWAFRGDAEAKLERLYKPAPNTWNQLAELYGPEYADILSEMNVAWRSMHSQGRGLLSLLMCHVDSLENFRIREGEACCTAVVGWNFGDGHLHDERMIFAVQEQCQFEPGEWLVVFVESQPIHKKTQEYRVIDASLGVVERGTYLVKDATQEQPWLPNGPIRHQVTWTAPGYTAPGRHERFGEVASAGRTTTE